MAQIRKRTPQTVVLLVAATMVAACDAERSSNPLSPNIAGPLAGITISAPTPVQPVDGQLIAVGAGAVTLLFQSAVSNSPRPFWHELQIAADGDFAQILQTIEEIQSPEGSAVVSVGLEIALDSGSTYYWRARALDGANTGPYSNGVRFEIYTPVTIAAPTLALPADGAITATNAPVLTVNNAAVTGPASDITYRFEIAATQSFSSLTAAFNVPASTGPTTSVPLSSLVSNLTCYWRVQVRATGRTGEVVGAFSATRSFRTPADAPPPPPPPPPPGGGGGADELDLSQVTFLHSNVSNWAITSTVTGTRVVPGEICVFHTAAGRWPFSTDVFPVEPGDPPGGAPIEGNIWIFAFINGRWHGATWDWLRPGQECKHEFAHTLGRDQIRIPPMDASWVPQKGDMIGLMMSTIARTSLRAGEERSNVVLIEWSY